MEIIMENHRNQRVLAYQLATLLDEKSLENIAGGSMSFKPSARVNADNDNKSIEMDLTVDSEN